MKFRQGYQSDSMTKGGIKVKKAILLVTAILLVALVVIGGCAQPAAPGAPGETTKTVTTTATKTTTATVTAPAKTVTTTKTVTAAPQGPEVYKWDMTYPLYRGTWDWDVLERWCDDLRVASGGRFDITPYSSGEIMPVMETFDAVSSGLLNIDFTYGPYWLGKLPMAIYSSGLPPFTLPRWEQYTVLYYNLGLEELLREAYAEHNIYHVAAMPTDSCMALTQFPITKAADFKGKKVRATGIYAELLTEAGASAVYFPWGEIYGALETGLIEGVVLGAMGCACDAGFHEPNQYLLETPISPVDGWALHVNMDAWHALPDDLKMILYESTSYAGDIFTASYFEWDAIWTKKLVEEWDYTITTLPVEEQRILSGYSMTVLDKYSAEDPIFAKATAILKDYMRSLGLLD